MRGKNRGKFANRAENATEVSPGVHLEAGERASARTEERDYRRKIVFAERARIINGA